MIGTNARPEIKDIWSRVTESTTLRSLKITRESVWA